MRHILYMIGFFIAPNLLAQNIKLQKVSTELKNIALEANSLFHYRMIEWWGTDNIKKNKALDKLVADYIIYHDSENIYFVLVDDTYEQKLGSYYMNIKRKESNIQFDSLQGRLSRKEKKLVRIKNKMEQNISEVAKMNIIERDGYSVSSVLMKQKNGYKMYLLTNTNEKGVIPLGNDAVFYGTNQGKIKKWERYHDNLLPMAVSREGSQLATHKHKKGQVLISPTEIANFRLYGMLYGMLKTSILIESEGIIIKYDANDNTIHAFYAKK